MTPDLVDLVQRAVACPRWRWLPGMRTLDAMRVIHDETLFPGRPCAIREGGWVDTAPPRPLRDAFPDLSDAATLGCLLALVREAWGDDRAYLCDFTGYDSVDWGVVSEVWDKKRNEDGLKPWFSCLLGDGPTEAEALVHALEKAPVNGK